MKNIELDANNLWNNSRYTSGLKFDGSKVLDAIPDLGLDHFYWSQGLASPDPWTDEDGLLDAAAVGSPTLDANGINGHQSMSYDGNNDYHETTSVASLGASQEYTIVFVIQTDDSAANQRPLWNGAGSDGVAVGLIRGSWQVSHNGVASDTGGTVTTDPSVGVATYDGSNFVMDINGSEVINTSLSAPTDPTGDMHIAARNDSTEKVDGFMGAAGIEAAAADAARRDDLTQKLADPFDISV